MYIVVDIETVPNDDIDLFLDTKSFRGKRGTKDPEKIKLQIEDAKSKVRQEAALHWWTGKVVMIGYTFSFGSKAETMHDNDEKLLLNTFAQFLQTQPNDLTLIGKNSADFDFPFLTGRYLANNIGIPKQLFNPKPLSDIDHIFSRSKSCGQVTTLDNYAWGLGLNPKSGSGSMVSTWYKDQDWKTMSQYCANDVEITAEMIRRYKPYGEV